jgi:spore coat polysaccharide biosynthesis protein SpsF (cytidylyltransferase family)
MASKKLDRNARDSAKFLERNPEKFETNYSKQTIYTANDGTVMTIDNFTDIKFIHFFSNKNEQQNKELANTLAEREFLQLKKKATDTGADFGQLLLDETVKLAEKEIPRPRKRKTKRNGK